MAKKSSTQDAELLQLVAHAREAMTAWTAAHNGAHAGQDAVTQVRALGQKLSGFAAAIDSVKHPLSIFDPTNPKTAARMIAIVLAAQPRHRLKGLERFYGSGVYASYYCGNFGAYAPLVGADHPIYVGKADPDNKLATTPDEQGDKLWVRLHEHRKVIEKVKASGTLDIDDFECRFLVVQTGYQLAAEAALIEYFRPIWNKETGVCHGIAMHGDDSSTRKNKRAPWHTLHPGVPWAWKKVEQKIDGETVLEPLPNQYSADEICENIRRHFERHRPHNGVQDMVTDFTTDVVQFQYSKSVVSAA